MAIYKIITGDSQEELIKQAGSLCQVYESSRHIKQAASREHGVDVSFTWTQHDSNGERWHKVAATVAP